MISSGKWLLQWEKKFWKFNHLYITICISDVVEERKIFEKYIWQRSLKIRLHVDIYNFINNIKSRFFSGLQSKVKLVSSYLHWSNCWFDLLWFFLSAFLSIHKQSWRNTETSILYLVYFLVTLCNTSSNLTVKTLEQGVKSVQI